MRCSRCRQKINATESMYVVVLDRHGTKLDYRIEKAAKTKAEETVLHSNGDPQCGKEVSGFRVNILKQLGVSEETDTQFLDYL